jgi:hypothetical protein
MITNLPTAELTKIGERLRSSRLIPQANYTLGIAAAAGPQYAALLRAGFLDEVAGARDDVDKARQTTIIMAVESKQATGSQQSLLHEATVWRHQTAKRALRAQISGASVPSELIHVGRSQSVSVVLEETSKTIGLLSEHAAALDAVGPPTQPLIDAGNKVYQALSQADSTQEQTRGKDLPAAVLDFYIKKAELYLGLKILNEAGHEFYAHNPEAAAAFNLSILYRRPNHGTTEPAPAPAPANTTPTTPTHG